MCTTGSSCGLKFIGISCLIRIIFNFLHILSFVSLYGYLHRKVHLGSCLHLLATAVDGERSSKLALTEVVIRLPLLSSSSSKANQVPVTNLKGLLKQLLLRKNNQHCRVLAGSIRLLLSCSRDDDSCCVKTRAALLGDKHLLPILGDLSGEVACRLHGLVKTAGKGQGIFSSKSANSAAAAATVSAGVDVDIITFCSKIIKELTFSETGKG